MASDPKQRKKLRATTRRRRRERQKQKAKRRWRWLGLLSPNGRFFVGAGTVATLVLAYYAFVPKITVSSTIEAKGLFDAPLEVKNESILSLHSLSFSCNLNRAYWPSRVGGRRNRIQSTASIIEELEPNESTTIVIPDAVRSVIGDLPPASGADVDIVIYYRPSFLPFHKSFQCRFVSKQVSSGGFLWIPLSKSER